MFYTWKQLQIVTYNISNKKNFQCNLLQQEHQIKVNYKTSEAVNSVAVFNAELGGTGWIWIKCANKNKFPVGVKNGASFQFVC